MKHPERIEDYLGHIAAAIMRAGSYVRSQQDIEAFAHNRQVRTGPRLGCGPFLSSEEKAGRTARRRSFSTGLSPVSGDSRAHILSPPAGQVIGRAASISPRPGPRADSQRPAPAVVPLRERRKHFTATYQGFP